jgi:hypothetical protein
MAIVAACDIRSSQRGSRTVVLGGGVGGHRSPFTSTVSTPSVTAPRGGEAKEM